MTEEKDTINGTPQKPKVLFFDIETAPNLSYIWAQYEQNALAHEQEWYMLCFSYKWDHQSRVKVVAQPDFDAFKEDPTDDSGVIEKLWDLLDEADVVIGHNLDKFDIRKANARFVQLGLGAPSPYKTIDTLKLARRYFMFNSNRLGDLTKLLGLGHKEATGGFQLWMDCMKGDDKAWRKMKKYAKQDTALLPSVYEALRPWMRNHPSMNLISQDPNACPVCGADEENLMKRGYRYTKVSVFQQWYCSECGSYSRTRISDKEVFKPVRVS